MKLGNQGMQFRPDERLVKVYRFVAGKLRSPKKQINVSLELFNFDIRIQ